MALHFALTPWAIGAEIVNGWRLEVTRSVGMEGTENYQNGYQAPFRVFQKIQFQDQVAKTDGKTIQEVNRTVTTAEFNSLDPQSGQMVKQEMIPSGSRFRVSHTPYGSTLFDGDSDEEIWNEEKVSALAPPVVPNLWPEGELRKGKFVGDRSILPWKISRRTRPPIC